MRGVRSHGPPVHYAPKSSVVNNSETSTPAPASPAIVFPSTGQLIAMYGVAQVAATRFRSLSSEVIKEDTGTFIRTAYRDGCVDAGCCMGIRKHVCDFSALTTARIEFGSTSTMKRCLFCKHDGKISRLYHWFQVRFNNDCPSWGWLKWSFNGPMLVAHRPFFHSCLECEKGDKNCLIISSACRGKHSQFWYFRIYSTFTSDQSIDRDLPNFTTYLFCGSFCCALLSALI